MNSMAAVIEPKSDQLNADDLIAGPRTITITKVEIRPGTEQPVSVHFDGDHGKPYKSGKSMNRVMVQAWGPDASKYVGRSLTLYRDPTVRFGKDEVGGIRISHMSHIDGPLRMALTATRGQRKAYTVQPLQVERQVASADALTIDVATDLLKGAGDLDELRAIWSRKAMAPFRSELQALLDERKAALTPAEPEDESFDD